MVVMFLVRLNKNFDNTHPDTQNIGAFTGFIASIFSPENQSKTFPEPPCNILVDEKMCYCCRIEVNSFHSSCWRSTGVRVAFGIKKRKYHPK